MTRPSRPTFSPEFRLESAQLVVDQGYSVKDAAEAMNVGKSTMDKWVRQLKQERSGGSYDASPMTSEQRRIRELERQVKRLETEKDIDLSPDFGTMTKMRFPVNLTGWRSQYEEAIQRRTNHQGHQRA